MKQNTIFSVIPREGGNPSDLAHNGSFLAAPRPSKDFRLHGNGKPLLVQPA
jgi:hypothetical protein